MPFPVRKRYRLPYFNYASSHLSFVTICTDKRVPLFGTVRNGVMHLSREGRMADESWLLIPQLCDYASLDEYVIMPDHIHGIIAIENPDEPRSIAAPVFAVRQRSVSTAVRNFKSAVTTKIRKLHDDPGCIVWQSRFYERIIRSDDALYRIREYIRNNPAAWEAKPQKQHQPL